MSLCTKLGCSAYSIVQRVIIHWNFYVVYLFLFEAKFNLFISFWSRITLVVFSIKEILVFFVFDKLHNGRRSLNLKSLKLFFCVFWFFVEFHGISCPAGGIEPVPHLTRLDVGQRRTQPTALRPPQCLKWFVLFYYNSFQENKGVSLCITNEGPRSAPANIKERSVNFMNIRWTFNHVHEICECSANIQIHSERSPNVRRFFCEHSQERKS
jgi:hypothetical protein